MKVKSYIPSFTQGISQQADKIKLPSQMKEQINGYSSLIEGLVKRPPTQTIKKLYNEKLKNPHKISISKDNGENYEILIHKKQIDIFDTEGNKIPVSYPDGVDYLECKNPCHDLVSCAVGDYVFIANKKINTKMLNDKFPNPYKNSVLFYVKQGDTNSYYEYRINGYTAKITIDNQPVNANTSIIASKIADSLTSKFPDKTKYNVAQRGSVVLFQCLTNEKPIDSNGLLINDGNGGRSFYGFYLSANDITDLPNTAPNGMVLKIQGDKGNKKDDYWVQFQTEDKTASFAQGNWVECPEPFIDYKFDSSTMPHALIRKANGTFSFEKIPYTERTCGNDESNTLPSFIGNPITDIFVHRARLCFLSGENCILSSSHDIYSFTKETTLTELDTDPIDTPASNKETANLRYAVPYNKELILFSRKFQHSLEGGTILNNKTASISIVTAYECSEYAKPASAGNNIFFTYEKGDFTGLREFYVNLSQVMDAEDITSYVSTYIPSGVYKIASSTLDNLVLLISDKTPNIMYVYKYFYLNSQRQQSSWSKWEFEGKIISADFRSNKIYLFMEYENEVYLEMIDLTLKNFDIDYISEMGKNIQFCVHLDRKIIPESFYDDEEDETIFLIPYTSKKQIKLINQRGIEEDIKLIEIMNNCTLLHVRGNLTQEKFIAGIDYNFLLEFPTIYYRNPQDNKVLDGEFQLFDLELSFVKTGHITAEITPLYCETMTYTYAGKILDTPASELNTTPITDGRFNIPILALNSEVSIVIKNNTHLPIQLIDAVIEGDYIKGEV